MSEEFYIELSPEGLEPLRAWSANQKPFDVLIYQGNRPPDQMNIIKVRRIPEEPAKECEHFWVCGLGSANVRCSRCDILLHDYLAKALAKKE